MSVFKKIRRFADKTDIINGFFTDPIDGFFSGGREERTVMDGHIPPTHIPPTPSRFRKVDASV